MSELFAIFFTVFIGLVTSFSDTGIGISAEDRERLFQPVFETGNRIESNDYYLIGQLAHRIIGAAGYCGASELIETATRLQNAARSDYTKCLQGFIRSDVASG